MATFPSLDNGPWTFNINNRITKQAAAADLQRNVWWTLKNVIVSFDEWSVVASSNGSDFENIGGGQPIDKWDSDGDIVGGQSWTVLENSVTGEQLCLDVYSTTLYYGHWRYSATGSFQADGNATTPPTVTESVDILPTATTFIDSTVREAMIHAMVSSDGKCTRVYIHQREYNSWYSGGIMILLEELKNPPSVWTSTHKRCALQISAFSLATAPITKHPVLANVDGQVWHCHLKDATTEDNFQAFPTASCYNSLAGGTAVPVFFQPRSLGFADTVAISPIGMFSPDVDHGGGYGRLQDIYFAPTMHDTFKLYDQPTSKAWIKFGCFIVPWNGTVPEYL
jgi:hypothetical protein